MQASEIVQMHLPASLVVLSACETDVGPVQGEEGVSALSDIISLGRHENSCLHSVASRRPIFAGFDESFL